MIRYFKELLATLKSIDTHLAKLSATVSVGYGGNSHSVLRTGKNEWDH